MTLASTAARRIARALPGLLLVSAAAAAPQDPFEPNDDCTAPPMLSEGTTGGLTLGPDDDYFTVSVPQSADIFVNAQTGFGSLSVELLEVGCGSLVASAVTAPLSYFDCGGLARDLVIRVPGGGASGIAYSLEFTTVEVPEDVEEDNDSCATGNPARIRDFTTPGLNVSGCDEDYYAAQLEDLNYELQIDLLFAHADGDIDVEIYDAGCNTLLASSTTTDDNESVSYTNPNPGPLNVTVRVFMKSGTGYNFYDLTACFGDGILPNVGNQACSGELNSTMRPGTLCARGSDVAADNALFLYVVDLPSGSAGYFITSPTSGFTPNPAGSQGNLCLGAPGRYSFAPLFTQTMSAVFYQPNLTQTPVAGGGFSSVMAGERRFWQYWYRDSVGGMAVSNFSSSLCVDFQ